MLIIEMMKNLLYVMLGGAVGAALRYLVGLLCAHFRWTSFPVATFLVNIIGCFLLGMLMAFGEKFTNFSGSTYLMLTVGLCGAFTTFSTFTADTFNLIENGQWYWAVLYLTLSVVVGFVLFYIGKKLMAL